MIKEEYSYNDISSYLMSTIDLLISGEFNNEERCAFFYNEFINNNKQILALNLEERNILYSKLFVDNHANANQHGEISTFLPLLLRKNYISQKNILLDLTSLDHVTIMTIINILINKVHPKKLFAGYITPKKYIESLDNYNNSLPVRMDGIMTIPGLAHIEKPSESVCAFLGFEGGRFQRIIELVKDANNIFPIYAIPLINPHWLKVSMWNSLDFLNTNISSYIINKCPAESVFDALNLLRDISTRTINTVLVPLGTRPHSASCAIFASNNKNTRIIYDYATETKYRTEGIGKIYIYNLTKFINLKR